MHQSIPVGDTPPTLLFSELSIWRILVYVGTESTINLCTPRAQTMLLVDLGLGRLLKEKQFIFLGGSASPPHPFLYRHF